MTLPAGAEPVVVATRYGVHPDRTRFVVELNEPVAFTVFTLADPYRVVVELPDVAWQIPPDAGSRGAGLIAGFRYGQFQPGITRIVIDLKAPARVKQAFTAPPEADRQYRLVVDLEATTGEAFLAELRQRAPPQAAAQAPPVVIQPPPAAAQPPPAVIQPPQAAVQPPSAAAQPPRVARPAAPAPAERKPKPDERRLIVIDAGHGGADPGTISPRGLQEKDITLAMAHELKRHLERDGRYRVLLSRQDDVFVRLRDRVEFARSAGADLFVSLHADSIGTSAIRGASVYTLSEQASDKEAEALAAKENKADVIGGIDLSDKSAEVSNILIDLAQRESMNQAARLAGLLIDQLRAVAPVLDRTHRFAGFAVLKAPDIPSVLIELGYLSNRADEQRLASDTQRSKAAGAMRHAIDGFFANQSAQRLP
ncbi:MAG: N-acetylmuramoyl-L-alanine amidase [Alphaproteobacteria bacterium]